LKIDEEEEFIIEDKGGLNPDDDKFDEIVGVLQTIILSEEFETLQNSFLDKNADVFTDDEENKLEYT